MYNPLDIHWDILNDIMLSYYLYIWTEWCGTSQGITLRSVGFIMWKDIPYKRGMQFSNKNVRWEAILSEVLSRDERQVPGLKYTSITGRTLCLAIPLVGKIETNPIIAFPALLVPYCDL